MSRRRDPFAEDKPPRDDKRQPILKPLGPRVTCEIEGCRQESMVLRRGLSVCRYHYDHEYQEAAREYAAERSLRTTKDHLRHTNEVTEKIGNPWNRERMIEHWRSVQANPRAYIAKEIAEQALAKLHAEAERVPGEDDF